VQRLRRRGVCCAPENWQLQLARIRSKLRISRPVLLMESYMAESPMVLGHFRPLILMPVGLLAGLPASQIEAILVHELAHIRRHDYLVNVIQRLAEGLFFYHPGVWWISRVMRTERENRCDDIVVSATGNAHEYATALAALEENRISVEESAIAATGGNLMKRIHRLLSPKAPSGVWAPLLAVAIFLATAAVSLAAWHTEPAKGSFPAPQAKVQGAAISSYSKWLDEDVVYIIDDAERAAFQELSTDEERNHFIEQFWERRNPTQGSAENKFKNEHYRRIAYANQHFRTASGGPGWQTDRGHMYIVYGPPDEIEAHAKGPQRPFATEIWLYRKVEGVGNDGTVTFVDRTGRGDFHLAPGSAR